MLDRLWYARKRRQDEVARLQVLIDTQGQSGKARMRRERAAHMLVIAQYTSKLFDVHPETIRATLQANGD